MKKITLVILAVGILLSFQPLIMAQTNTQQQVTQAVQQSTSKLNINTATQSDFEKLPGIGPTIAKRIVEYRKEHGSFKTIEELKNVSGIGDKKFEAIKDLITVE